MLTKVMKLDPILRILFQKPGLYVSGEYIAQQLSISRSAVQKRVQKLVSFGYHISSSPKKGIILEPPYPFKILPELIANQLQYPIDLFYLDQSTSTNTMATQLDQKEPFVLISREQLQGKGRAGRTWTMQRDKDIALTFSMPVDVFYEDVFSSLIHIASLSVYKTLCHYAPDQIYIKWPNDLISRSGQKICGVLTSSMMEENICNRVIVGIGVNINSTQLPEYAISLFDLIGHEININDVYMRLINYFMDYWYHFSSLRDQIFQEWYRYLAWVGEEVCFIKDKQEHIGIFKRVDTDGSVVLDIDHYEYKFITGDLSCLSLRKNS
ncbi:MAG: biotin--[acetyl-CoA-carboxylase] ligase [Brevinema sp.]